VCGGLRCECQFYRAVGPRFVFDISSPWCDSIADLVRQIRLAQPGSCKNLSGLVFHPPITVQCCSATLSASASATLPWTGSRLCPFPHDPLTSRGCHILRPCRSNWSGWLPLSTPTLRLREYPPLRAGAEVDSPPIFLTISYSPIWFRTWFSSPKFIQPSLSQWLPPARSQSVLLSPACRVDSRVCVKCAWPWRVVWHGRFPCMSNQSWHSRGQI